MPRREEKEEEKETVLHEYFIYGCIHAKIWVLFRDEKTFKKSLFSLFPPKWKQGSTATKKQAKRQS